jgi:4-amino-4-deoxy-L-arabinose transferase-like glycosyltransferase
MDEAQESFEKRKKLAIDKIKQFTKDPLNIALVAVLLFAFILRLYYFIKVGNQPLWWDEAVYGGMARNFVSHLWDGTIFIVGETSIRPFLLPFLWSLLLRIGMPEGGVRFFLEFVPSIISVFFVYLIGKETFGKRVGIIAAFIFSVLWIHLFYTVRLLTNIPALIFLFASIYLFMKSIESKFNFNLFTISLILLSLSTLMRYPNGIIFLVYLLALIINKKLLITKVKFWASGFLGIFPMLIFFVYNFIKYQNIFPALLGGQYINAGAQITTPFAFNLLNYIPIYLKTVFFICFLIGIVVIIFEIIAGYNLVHKIKKLKNSFLLLLIFIAVYAFFIFYTRSAEDRYFFPVCASLCCFVGFGIDFIYTSIKKYNKQVAVIALVLILGFGAYAQVTFTDDLIENKQASYLQFRQGFEWMKDNVPAGSKVLGTGIDPYVVYYSELGSLHLPQNYSEGVNDAEADYLVDHYRFTPRLSYMDQYLEESKDKWKILKIFFFDPAQTQPAVVIYEKIN